MADSLLLCRLFELLGGGVTSDLPQCSGAMFRLGDQYSMGTPQPVVDFIVSLMGDGERLVGWRMSNRTIVLPVTIIVPPTGNIFNDRLTLSAAREALLEAVNVDQFEVVWSPDGTLGTRATVFDCQRANATAVDFNYKYEKGLLMTVTLSFEAYPWGRSDTASQITFDSPVVAGVATPATPPYTMNDFESVPVNATFTTANTAPNAANPFETALTVTITSTASAQADPTTVVHGSQSCLINVGASSGTVKLAWTTPYTGPQQWFRFEMNVGVLPALATTLMQMTNAVGTPAQLQLQPDGTLSMDAGPTLLAVHTTNPVPLNQWVRVEGWVTGDQVAGQVSVSLFTSLDSATPLETQTSAATMNTIGVPTTVAFGVLNATTANWGYSLDDLALSGNGAVGPFQQFSSAYLPPNVIDQYDIVSSASQYPWWSRSPATAFAMYAARWSHEMTDGRSPLLYSRALYDATGVDTFDLNTEGWQPDGYTAGVQQDFEMGTAGVPVTSANTVSTGFFPNETAPNSGVVANNGATVTFDSTQTHGLVSAKCVTPGAGQAFAQWSPALGTTKQWFRFYVYIPAGQPAITLGQFNAGGHASWLFYTAGGKLAMAPASGTAVITSTASVPVNQMVRIEGFTVGDPTVGQVSFSMYSGDSTSAIETQTSAANLNTTGTVTLYGIGITQAPGSAATIWVDDVALSGTAALGPAAGVSRITSSPAPHSGAGCLALTAAGTPSTSTAAESGFATACTNGEVLTVTAWVQAAVTARTVTLGVNFYAGTTLVNFTSVASATDTAGVWTKLTGTVTVPTVGSNVITKARLRISVASAAALEVHAVDDPSMVKGATVDITSRDKLSFWLGMGVPASSWRGWHQGTVHFAVTLTDIAGVMLKFGAQRTCKASNRPDWPFWNPVSMKITQGAAAFQYNKVAAYSIQAWTEVVPADKRAAPQGFNAARSHFRATGYLSGLRAAATASPMRPASDRGGDYQLYGIDGTAPSLLSLHCQLGFTTFTASTQTFSLPGNPGTPQSWYAPSENPNWLNGDTADFDEKGTVGDWTGSDGLATNSTLTNSTTFFNSGTASMKVVPVAGGSNAVIASAPTASITQLGVPCVPGDRISLRANVRAGTTARNITVGAEFFTSGGVSVSRVDLAPVADVNTGFTLISGRVTAPATAAFARQIVTIATPAAAEAHYFDDMYISWALQATVICNGPGGAGGSTKPTFTSAGGGGGGEIAWETNLDLNPLLPHLYTIGLGGAASLSGANGGNGSPATTFAGATTTVTANGGTGGQNRLTTDYSNGTGGAGGTGSTNAHHFNGGTGGTGNHSAAGLPAGGGGGSGGDGGAGGNGASPTGGTAGTAGSLTTPGAGGGAGQHSGGGGGYGGGQPGGGGGGASSQTNSHLGGSGGAGRVKMVLTTYTAAANFPCLLVHKPAPRTGVLSKAVIPIGAGQDSPDGREYPVGLVDGFNARYNGTYTVYAVNTSWNGAGARTVTATIRQYEAAGGAVSTATAAQSITPSAVVNGMVNLGEVTLPVKDMADDNTDSYFTVALTSANVSDRFLDLLLIDSSGQTVLINIPGAGYTDYWIDAPDLQRDLGHVLGSVLDRQQAVSVLGSTYATGGPLRLNPGNNTFTVYSPSGMPGLEGEYTAKWWLERLY